ncbi:MAG: TolC family protein [Sandaracinus sp.]
MTTKTWTIALCLLVVPLPASAQVSLTVTAPTGTTGTRYGQYVERVMAESPTLAQALAEVRSAEAAIDVARVLPSPRLSGGVASVDVSGHNAPNATQLVLTVPIDYAGQTGRRVDARAAEQEAVMASAEAVRRQLGQQAAERFVDALEAELALARATEAAAADDALLAAIEHRLSVGEATALEVGLARLAAAQGHARRAEAEGRARTTRIALSTLLGEADGTLVPVGDLGVPPQQFDAASLVEDALAHRPEIRAAQMREAAAGRTRELASAARWPELDVQVGWYHSFSALEPGSIFNQPEYDALILGATIEIPIRLAWDGDLRSADAAIEHASAALRAEELVVELEVREALAQYEAARDQLAARETALAEATALRRAAAEALTRGASTVVEQLAANAAAREAEAAYLTAAASHARALAVLLARVGREAPAF